MRPYLKTIPVDGDLQNVIQIHLLLKEKCQNVLGWGYHPKESGRSMEKLAIFM